MKEEEHTILRESVEKFADDKKWNGGDLIKFLVDSIIRFSINCKISQKTFDSICEDIKKAYEIKLKERSLEENE